MSAPIAILIPITKEARRSVGESDTVLVTHFPFRVGRAETRADGAIVNDLDLHERPDAHSLHVSSEHFSIELAGSGFVVVDRGSACGLVVNGYRVGGRRKGGERELRPGDQIVVGTSQSPYVFRFDTVQPPASLQQ